MSQNSVVWACMYWRKKIRLIHMNYWIIICNGVILALISISHIPIVDSSSKIPRTQCFTDSVIDLQRKSRSAILRDTIKI